MIRKPRLRLALLLWGGALLGLNTASLAQTAISSWTLTTSDLANATKYGSDPGGAVVFENGTRTISTFTAGGGTYRYWEPNGFPGGSSTYIRRSTDASDTNAANIWIFNTAGGDDSIVSGVYQGLLSYHLGTYNILNGGEELFVNGTGSATVSAGNIERIDFYWGATTIGNLSGLTVFDRGVGDNIQIAVFTGWDAVNDKPTAYGGNVVALTSANFSASGLDLDPNTAGTQTTAPYDILRFHDGDETGDTNGTLLGTSYRTTDNTVVGAFISFADLGIDPGTIIYGYSIMSSDVTNTIGNLADWTSSTYYPTNTSIANGGLDLVGFNGYLAAPVPEPATYGAILIGLSLAGWYCRLRHTPKV